MLIVYVAAVFCLMLLFVSVLLFYVGSCVDVVFAVVVVVVVIVGCCCWCCCCPCLCLLGVCVLMVACLSYFVFGTSWCL